MCVVSINRDSTQTPEINYPFISQTQRACVETVSRRLVTFSDSNIEDAFARQCVFDMGSNG